MKIIMTAVIAALLVLPARADDKDKTAATKTGWGDFFKNLKNTLAQSAVGGERKRGRGAAVAAVRGKKQKNMADPNEPTLKGDVKTAKAKKEAEYDAELEKAIDLIAKGKLEEGLKSLDAFKVSHPKHRSNDVDKAIEGAKAMIADKGGDAPL